jgi:hypothetical protein
MYPASYLWYFDPRWSGEDVLTEREDLRTGFRTVVCGSRLFFTHVFGGL